MAEKTAEQPKDAIKLVVTDDKGKVHEVKTNFMKEKIRDAITGGRAVAWFILIWASFSFIRHYVVDPWISLALVVPVALIIRPLIFTVKIDEEEMKTMRPLAKDEKLN